VTHNSVTLRWTTPGDDSLTGTASQFDIRFSTSPITAANFSGATRWTTGVPTPGTPGTSQTVTVTGLSPATTYYFAMKTADEVPNWAGVSNVISRTTLAAPDAIRPAAIATVAVTGTTETTIAVNWTATGDDSLTGTAASYDMRYSTSPITAANFASATAVSGEPVPTAAGTVQSKTITGLARQTTYYIAMKSTDDAGNVSAISNVVSTTTPDATPPSAITDLAVSLVGFGWHLGDARTASGPVAAITADRRRRID
jgi:chitodextrinase